MPKNGEFFIFPIADGTVKLSGGDQVFRNPPQSKITPRGEENNDVLHGERESDGTQPLDTLKDDGEARNDFGRLLGITFTVITLNQE